MEIVRPKISIDRNTVLGKGFFSNVFKGKYINTPVAVKRIKLGSPRTKSGADRPTEIRVIATRQKLNHQHVLQIYAIEEDYDFR